MAYLDISFVKANPSGNTTILVLTPLPRELYARAARLLMQENILCAEQVGFVEKTAAGSRLQMMGGEFCGNASRSYAAWLLMGREGGNVQIEVSGHKGLLSARVEATGRPHSHFVEIEMPAPSSIIHGEDALLGPYSIVIFAGIIHGVFWEKAADSSLLPHFRGLLGEYRLDDNCCGMMFVEQQAQAIFMRPLVYVGQVDSVVWEQSCGSGSLALLCGLADKTKQSYHRLAIKQPGGELLLSGEYGSAGITNTRLSGEIHFTAEGIAHIDI